MDITLPCKRLIRTHAADHLQLLLLILVRCLVKLRHCLVLLMKPKDGTRPLHSTPLEQLHKRTHPSNVLHTASARWSSNPQWFHAVACCFRFAPWTTRRSMYCMKWWTASFWPYNGLRLCRYLQEMSTNKRCVGSRCFMGFRADQPFRLGIF